MAVEIRRGSARFVEKLPGRATWHGLSFGQYYDPARLNVGPIVCHDEHLLGNGKGFDTHTHADIDIVTVVVSGQLTHRDSLGTETQLNPGEIGWLRAGAGVEHSEIASAPQTRFVQVWLRQAEGESAWQSFSPDTSASVELPSGTLHVLRLVAGEAQVLPEGDLRHVFVASGSLRRSSLAEPLAAGDTMIVRPDTEADTDLSVPLEARAATTEGPVAVTAAVDSIVLVWTLPLS